MFVRIANSPRALVIVFLVTILGSAVVYAVAEHSDYLNAVYWSVVTATTLGYGEFSPHTEMGKVLTSVLMATAGPSLPIRADKTLTSGSSSLARRQARGSYHAPDLP